MGQFDAEQLEESTTSLVSSSTSAYSSFPVDVVVYVRVQVLKPVHLLDLMNDIFVIIILFTTPLGQQWHRH